MAGKQLRSMDISKLLSLRAEIDTLLSKRRKTLEDQLAALGSAGNATIGTAVIRKARKKTRAKAKPKYQSKKNKSLKWSGRGMMPVWMREEMKGTKLKKLDFAIK